MGTDVFAQGRKRKIANAQNGNARMRCENDEGMVGLVSDEELGGLADFLLVSLVNDDISQSSTSMVECNPQTERLHSERRS